MALGTPIKQLFWLIPLLCELSCVDAPVELVLDKKLHITEAKVNEISDDILTEIKKIDVEVFGSTIRGVGTADPEDCKKAFNNWITEEFKKDLVPKRVINASEYGAFSSAPHMDQCHAIDLEKEFKLAKDRASQNKTRKDSILFNFKKLRDAFSEAGPCTSNYIAPDKRKLRIGALKLHITNNTLNVNSPVYKIYYTTVPLTEAQLEEEGAEQKLTDNGSLKLFAKSRPVPAFFTGTLDFEMIEDPQALEDAKAKIETFNTELIAIPSKMDRDFETSIKDGQAYFVVPRAKGEGLKGKVGVALFLRAAIGDALCAWQQYKKQIKEEQSQK